MTDMELDFDQLRDTAKQFRRAKVLSGTFPRRGHAWPRTVEKSAALERRMKEKIRRKGVFRIKDGSYVLLGTYPDSVVDYIVERKELPENFAKRAE